jgi:hypothetical protein
MRAYRETFRRHRVLFCLPPLLFAVVLALLAFSTPKKYQSYASLWIDNGPSAQSSLSSGVSAPSASEQTLLGELLATQAFDRDVGKNSLLTQYLAAHGVSKGQMDAMLAAAVGSGVSTSAPGPQVLTVTFTGPTPAVARSVLESLIVNVQRSISHFGHTFGRSAQAYFQQQVKTAKQALASATAATNAYGRDHPSATANNDQSYAALIAAQQSANSQVATATTGLDQATGQATGDGVSSLVQVVDSPSIPTSPTTGMMSAMKKVVGGFAGGLLLSVILIVAMTRSGEDRWDAELSGDGWDSAPAQPVPGPAHPVPSPAQPVAISEAMNPQALPPSPHPHSPVPAPGALALRRFPRVTSERRIAIQREASNGDSASHGEV